MSLRGLELLFVASVSPSLMAIGTRDVLVQLIYMGLFCGVAALSAWRTNPATLTADRQPPLSLVVDGAIGTDHADRQTYPA